MLVRNIIYFITFMNIEEEIWNTVIYTRERDGTGCPVL